MLMTLVKLKAPDHNWGGHSKAAPYLIILSILIQLTQLYGDYDIALHNV